MKICQQYQTLCLRVTKHGTQTTVRVLPWSAAERDELVGVHLGALLLGEPVRPELHVILAPRLRVVVQHPDVHLGKGIQYDKTGKRVPCLLTL